MATMRGAGSAPKSNVLSSKAIPVQESRKSKSRKHEKSRGRNRCLQGGGSKRILFEESARFSQPHTGFSCHKRGAGVSSRHHLMKKYVETKPFCHRQLPVAGAQLVELPPSYRHRSIRSVDGNWPPWRGRRTRRSGAGSGGKS